MTSAMFREAVQAPAAVARQLASNRETVRDVVRHLKASPPRAVVTVARGSSDNAATYAKYLIETRLGILTASAAPSVSSVYDRRTGMQGVLVLAISQSGKSPDLLAALDHARKAGAFIVGLVNAPGSPLESMADAVLPLCAGPELSVAATKSYVASLAALANLVARWSDDGDLIGQVDRLPQQLEQAWACDWSPALDVLASARDLYVIGRGIGFGVAQEAALKLKETCGLHAEAFSAAEVLHGPMALVQEGFPVLAFSQDDQSRESIRTMTKRFGENRARMLLAGFDAPGAITLPTIAAPAVLEPILMIQSFYRMAEALSRLRGFDPDAPPHLKKITETV
jgi:glucosamine--fructose-6-phosphate aminotransferase (isomerizing)